MEQFAFPRYEDYKPSGLDWLGEIPTHWSLKRSPWRRPPSTVAKPDTVTRWAGCRRIL